MPTRNAEAIAESIERAFVATDDLVNRRCEPANVVDVIRGLELAMRSVSHAIAADAAPGRDAAGGHISSLTEAAMGITAGLFRIAEAIDNLAASVTQER